MDKIEYVDSRTFLYCHLQRKAMIYCGEASKKVNEVRIRHLPHMLLEDETVIIAVVQRRFYFPEHKIKRWESLPDVSPRKQTTDTFRLNTLRELQSDNYSGTGNKRHKSHMYPSQVLDSMDIQMKWDKPIKIIGLDGKGVGQNNIVHNITNLSDKKPLMVLPNLNQEQFKKN